MILQKLILSNSNLTKSRPSLISVLKLNATVFVVFSNIIIIVFLQNDCYDYGWYIYVHDYPLRAMDLGFLR